MDDFTLARVVHVLAIVFWIGGVAFVTLVLMPMLSKQEAPEARLAKFAQVEGGFAWQARIWVLLAGMSGFWMAWRAEMWSRFAEPAFWWMHAMVVLWVIFAAMLFVAEPVFLHRRMARSPTPARDFKRMVRMHRLLLALSAITVFGAVGGSHGLF